ncbi:hypothetical protein A3K72_00235 [Candidatus Woesearchaeota archaeon RBG_13_36_6]|nr:MAG: hypothetical protein A3K72_00235 [Candidatus Woesearchaeota archaeon RBG_13_36_6]
MKTYATVVGVVKYKDRILLLKRHSKRSCSPNKWQPVSGYFKEKEAAEDAVLREVKEETGLDGKIIKAGKVFENKDKWGRWITKLFLIKVKSNKLKLDPHEHSEHRWIKPAEYSKFECIGDIKKDLKVLGLI